MLLCQRLGLFLRHRGSLPRKWWWGMWHLWWVSRHHQLLLSEGRLLSKISALWRDFGLCFPSFFSFFPSFLVRVVFVSHKRGRSFIFSFSFSLFFALLSFYFWNSFFSLLLLFFSGLKKRDWFKRICLIQYLINPPDNYIKSIHQIYLFHSIT